MQYFAETFLFKLVFVAAEIVVSTISCVLSKFLYISISIFETYGIYSITTHENNSFKNDVVYNKFKHDFELKTILHFNVSPWTFGGYILR